MKEISFKLEDKVAIITGGSQGIGKGIAIGMAQYGADIVIADLNKEMGLETIKEIEEIGRKAIFIKTDISDLSMIKNMVSETVKAFGKIDILVNNAGFIMARPSVELEEELWDKVLNVNLKGAFYCSQEAGKIMIKNNYGRIINIASQVGLVAVPEFAHYCASKGGMIQFTKVLALEWAEHNINVTAIAPTFVKTPLTIPFIEDKEFYEDQMRRIPKKRMGEVEDIAAAAIYLASDAADFVTGSVLLVDGGYLAM